MISSDEAFLMLNKWREEQHPLKLLIAGDGFRMSFAGTIDEVDGSRLTFLPVAPNSCEGDSILELAECRFEYGDSREAPRGSVSGLKFESILTILRPDGTTFMFAELRV
jgi:hypothetical protein